MVPLDLRRRTSAVGPRREGGTVGVSALARNTILALGAFRRVMTHLWRLLSMKALKGKVTHSTGAGTPYGDRLDRAPRPSGRRRRGLAHRARCTLGLPTASTKRQPGVR